MGSRVCGVIVGVMLLGVAGMVCLTSSLFPAPSRMVSHGGQWSLHSAREVVRYHVPGAVQHVQLALDVQADTGELVWTVLDPAGEVCWQGQLIAGEHVARTLDFPAQRGEWRLVFTLHDVTGHYEARWES